MSSEDRGPVGIYASVKVIRKVQIQMIKQKIDAGESLTALEGLVLWHAIFDAFDDGRARA